MSNTPLINVSPTLAPLTQDNYLNRVVRDALQPEYVWRNAASTDAENFPHREGMPEIISVRGLMTPNLTPNNVNAFTDPLAGMTVSNAISYEMYLGQFDRYDKLLTCNLHGEDFAIVSQFEENIESLAQYASSVDDFLARNALYGTYSATNTFAIANAASGANQIRVDDVRGFVVPTGAKGEVPTATIVVGTGTSAVTYTLSQVQSDVVQGNTNVSGLVFTDVTGQMGVSGTLTIQGTLSAAVPAGTAVAATAAPAIIRSTNAQGQSLTNYTQIGATNLLTAAMIRKAKGILWGNRAPRFGKNYILYADNYALQGLYLDPEFQSIFRGQPQTKEWRQGQIAELLGVDIVECTSNPLQILPNGQVVSRPMLVARGALTRFEATSRMIREPAGAGPTHVMQEGNIAFVNRASIDPGAQFVTQAMLMFVGHSARTDRLITSAVIPSASAANYKRAVMFEVAGL